MPDVIAVKNRFVEKNEENNWKILVHQILFMRSKKNEKEFTGMRSICTRLTPPSNGRLHDRPLRLPLLTVIGFFFATTLTVSPSVFPRYLEAISYVFPLMLMMAWMLFIADFVKKLVHERELRLHEVMLFTMQTEINPVTVFCCFRI